MLSILQRLLHKEAELREQQRALEAAHAEAAALWRAERFELEAERDAALAQIDACKNGDVPHAPALCRRATIQDAVRVLSDCV